MRPDGSPAVELRLWDAPRPATARTFEYCASTDNTDLGSVRWRPAWRTGTARQGHQRQRRTRRLVIHAIDQYVADHEAMRAIAFCVDIAHQPRTLHAPAGLTCTRGHQRHATRTARARPSRAGRRRAQGSLHCRSLTARDRHPGNQHRCPTPNPEPGGVPSSSWAAGCGLGQ